MPPMFATPARTRTFKTARVFAPRAKVNMSTVWEAALLWWERIAHVFHVMLGPFVRQAQGATGARQPAVVVVRGRQVARTRNAGLADRVFPDSARFTGALRRQITTVRNVRWAAGLRRPNCRAAHRVHDVALLMANFRSAATLPTASAALVWTGTLGTMH